MPLSRENLFLWRLHSICARIFRINIATEKKRSLLSIKWSELSQQCESSERMKLLFVSIISIFPLVVRLLPLRLKLTWKWNSSLWDENSTWDLSSGCFSISFYFFSLLPFSAQHIAIDKTGQSHDFTFHRIQLSRMIDENWLLLHSLLPVLLPPSCVAFQHFMPVCLLIFRVVNSRNWRMGKTSTVSLRFHFSSNLSWAMHGESRRR